MKTVLMVMTVLLCTASAKTDRPLRGTEAPKFVQLPDCNATVFVGEGKKLLIKVPCVERDTVIDLAAVVLLRAEDPKAKERLRKVLQQSPSISITVTTDLNPAAEQKKEEGQQ